MKQEQISQQTRKMLGQTRISLIARLFKKEAENAMSSFWTCRIINDEEAINFFLSYV